MKKTDTNVRQIRRKPATDMQPTRNKSAAKTPNKSEISTDLPRVRFLCVPYMRQMRDKMRKNFEKNTAQFWIPVECSLLTRYEFATLMSHTRYIYVALLLHCGANGIDEIPTDTRYLASILNVDERTIAKSLDELENAKLLTERKKDREENKEKTDRQIDENGVCVDDLNSFSEEEKTETENQNGLLKLDSVNGHHSKKNLSQFTIEECLKYVEHCRIEGESIQSPKALAMKLFKSGEADSFILQTLYPEKQKSADLVTFGLPTKFTDEPCRVCFGAKMADVDGNGYRSCGHCKNEKGKSIGYEPKGENGNENTTAEM